MSEAAENEGIQNDGELDNEVQISASEAKARESGWKPENEWEGEDDKKPQEFISAEMFNERGVWIQRHKDQQKRMDDLEQNFNTRMDNANKLRDQQIEMQKSDLIRKRDDAIDLADKDTANQIQSDIDKLNVQPEPVNQASPDQPIIDAWNAANPWIYQPGPKAAYANAQVNAYQSRGESLSDALAAVDKDIAREFPAVNTARDTQARSEGGSKPGGKRGSAKVTMNDLTPQEADIWKHMSNSWPTEADFLQSVQDVRNES